MHPTLVDPRRRADAGAARARIRRTCGAWQQQGGLRPLRDGHAGGHLHGAVDPPHRAAAERPRRGRQRLVLPRSRRGLAVAPVEPADRGREDLGGRQAARSRTSPAPRCSGGTTCTPRPTGARRRGRCTRRTAARSRTTTRIRPSCTTSSTPGSAPFPLFKFWGPAADITSSQWIARATMHVRATRKPTLTLCYLPHLDYDLQRLGPDLEHPRLQKDLAGDRRARAAS